VLKKSKRFVSATLCTFMAFSTIATAGFGGVANAATDKKDNPYNKKFLELYDKVITNGKENGYLSEEGVPYHSIETMMCEAPDYGHETVSETASYYNWITAYYGYLTGEWEDYNTSWDILEKYYIPSEEDQPNLGDYDPSKCASFVNASKTPEEYPGKLDTSSPTGADNLHKELVSAYGTTSMYLMHWIFDVDNWYKYGNHGDGTSRVSQINTYQRGEQESCWETIPFPCWETFKWGNGKSGFLALFVDQSDYAQQWRYSVASDADARSVQAAYWANKWAAENGSSSDVSDGNEKAAKLGDYLRYAMYDKYMKPIGTATLSGPAGDGENSMHYLIAWFTAWGAPIKSAKWAWKEGCSASHQGYQNPMTAYALSTVDELEPKSSNGKSDWAKSLDRQIEMLTFLQSDEGAIAGGVNNAIGDNYEKDTQGLTKFYGMTYDWQPVWHDPPSNRWYGFQAWGLQRLAEYYYESGDERAYNILKKWSDWACDYIEVTGSTIKIPGDLKWEGMPEEWKGMSSFKGNPKLHCTIENSSSDLGIAGSTANLLAFFAAGAEKHAGERDETAYKTAKALIDCIIDNYSDDLGYTIEEERSDYSRFFESVVAIPKGWTGKNAQGAEIKTGMKFIDMRPDYKKDANWNNLKTSYDAGKAPKFTYHRFWHQVDIAMGMAAMGMLFEPPVSEHPEDVNGDGSVNMQDVMAVAKEFGKTGFSGPADVNKDGSVNMQDVIAIAKVFGQTF